MKLWAAACASGHVHPRIFDGMLSIHSSKEGAQHAATRLDENHKLDTEEWERAKREHDSLQRLNTGCDDGPHRVVKLEEAAP